MAYYCDILLNMFSYVVKIYIYHVKNVKRYAISKLVCCGRGLHKL